MYTQISLIFILLFLCLSTTFANDKVRISVMTFNIENGGTQIDFAKVVEAVKKAKADIVGIQEAWGNTSRLAKELGWKYYDTRLHVVSRYPLYDSDVSDNKYIFVAIKPDKVIAIANIHLPDEPYGPYLIRDGASAAVVENNELETRLPTAIPTISALSALATNHVPVFLTGDFNSPGHLDWTRTTINKFANHPYAVNWPVTKTIIANGLIDSFRAAHPDVIRRPGLTWPSGREKLLQSKDGFNPTERDPKDRIDFIFAGNARVLSSYVIGERKYPQVDIVVEPWPSDHRAVVSRFEVVPVAAPAKLIPIVQHLSSSKPFIQVETSKVTQNTPLTIYWGNAPGNGYDYIAIEPVNSTWSDAVHLYTHSAINGSLQLNAKNIQGNWTAWHKVPEAHWPLPAGIYKIKLMADDSDKMLASANIEVKS